jgi:hypothetical protein
VVVVHIKGMFKVVNGKRRHDCDFENKISTRPNQILPVLLVLGSTILFSLLQEVFA